MVTGLNCEGCGIDVGEFAIMAPLPTPTVTKEKTESISNSIWLAPDGGDYGYKVLSEVDGDGIVRVEFLATGSIRYMDWFELAYNYKRYRCLERLIDGYSF